MAAQVVIKMAEADMSPSTLGALRFGIAALCFAPAAARGLRKADLRAAALELGAWLFGAALCLMPVQPIVTVPAHLGGGSHPRLGQGQQGQQHLATMVGLRH